ncbi:MAG: hypothetical protein E6Q50_15290 [Lysobacter sp.]|nr:MAG: hypothetical protein E6Q50_15290 [Lysobacter sp.]
MTLRADWLLWFALYAALGYAGAALARRYALQRRLMDEPGERRSHSVPTPRGGGIAIVAALSIAALALIVRQPRDIVETVGGALGLWLVAGIGWLDDHRPLSPWLRLSVHALAATALAFGAWLGGASFAAATTTWVLCVVLVNVWNFMDGIDGLASTQAALVAAAFAFCAGSASSTLLALATIGAIFGFLPFNLPKARLFLGDVGSGALGYALAWLAALAMDAIPQAAWPWLLLPLSAFLLDAGLTLSSRIVRGERWWLPHVEHVYQRWARRTGSHLAVSGVYALWTAIAAIMCGFGVSKIDAWGADEIAWAVSAWWGLGGVLWYGFRRRAIGSRAEGTSDRGVDA